MLVADHCAFYSRLDPLSKWFLVGMNQYSSSNPLKKFLSNLAACGLPCKSRQCDNIVITIQVVRESSNMNYVHTTFAFQQFFVTLASLFMCAPSSHLWSFLLLCPPSFYPLLSFVPVSLWVIWIRADAPFLSLSHCIIDQSNLSRPHDGSTQSGLNGLLSSQPWFLLDKTINWAKNGRNVKGSFCMQCSVTPPFCVGRRVCISTTWQVAGV